MTRPFVVGVTGGIATGKSAVLAMLAENGFQTIDADRVYHELIVPGGALVAPLVERFGASVLAGDGSIDRRALGAIVFGDAAAPPSPPAPSPRGRGERTALEDLDRITHPVVAAEVARRVAASDSARIAIDAVKLIEAGMDRLCDSVWLVVADPDVQRARLMARNGLTVEEANQRLAAQPDEGPRRAVADHVIDNSGTLAELRDLVSLTLAKSLPKG